MYESHLFYESDKEVDSDYIKKQLNQKDEQLKILIEMTESIVNHCESISSDMLVYKKCLRVLERIRELEAL